MRFTVMVQKDLVRTPRLPVGARTRGLQIRCKDTNQYISMRGFFCAVRGLCVGWSISWEHAYRGRYHVTWLFLYKPLR